jgi:hypothetical protein
LIVDEGRSGNRMRGVLSTSRSEAAKLSALGSSHTRGLRYSDTRRYTVRDFWKVSSGEVGGCDPAAEQQLRAL